MTPVLSSLTIPELYQLMLDSDDVERAMLMDYVKEHWANWQGWEWLAREGKKPLLRPCDALETERAFMWFPVVGGCPVDELNMFSRLTANLHEVERTGIAHKHRRYPTLESALCDAARAAQQAIDAKEIET